MTRPENLPLGDAKALLCELCRQFYQQGWVSGTGGGISIRAGSHIVMAPSGVQKERLQPQDLFVLDAAGAINEAPKNPDLRLSACAPLFMHAYQKRGAGAVIHNHSAHAVMATLLADQRLSITHLEMLKGISGVGYHDTHEVPVIENTAHECDLADDLATAIDAHPKSFAVLVRRHGVYVWGDTWAQAKTHAETYDYLFDLYARMHARGMDASDAPRAQTRTYQAVHSPQEKEQMG